MSSQLETNRRRRPGLLIGILLGAVFGAVLGLSYGRTMWLASGGVERRLDRLQKTIAQKSRFAREADTEAKQAAAAGRLAEALRLQAEADRYRRHMFLIGREIERMKALRAEAAEVQRSGARTVWLLARFCGELFLRMLRLLVVPLVFTSMVCGITSLGDIRRLGKLGGWTLLYYLATAAVAVLIGMLLVCTIRPGRGADDTFAYVAPEVLARQRETVLETLLAVVAGSPADPGGGMVPENIFLAASQTNVLAVIVFALVFGGALTTLGQRGQSVVDFFHAVNEVILKIVHLVMLFAPVGILGLIAAKIAESGGAAGFSQELVRLGWFVVTVLVGLAIHVVVLSVILVALARRNPFVFLYGVARALLTALSTASSSATLPVTIECVEEMDISEESAGFVLPLGATINMDGTALYEAVAAIFIAQSAGVPLGVAGLTVIFITATLAAIGAPGIPQAGLVTLVIVLTAVHLPATGIGTILAIDWFLDRNRTAVNVYGDSVGAAVIDRYFCRPAR